MSNFWTLFPKTLHLLPLRVSRTAGLGSWSVLYCSSTDDTLDPVEDEQQFSRIKDWISSHHLDTVEVTDVLSNFPDISVVRISTVQCSGWILCQKLSILSVGTVDL